FTRGSTARCEAACCEVPGCRARSGRFRRSEPRERTHAELLGYGRDFLILDRSDARELITACLREANIETRGKVFPKPDVLLEMFSESLNLSMSLEEVIEKRHSTFWEKTDQVEEVYRAYTRRKFEQNRMDFDDLLSLPLRLFKEHPDILEYYQKRFSYILVDEYQDTNHTQNEFLELLAARSRGLMVVGDDAQSIYSWRGACFQNILEFTKRHPNARTYTVETNYRSSDPILKVANESISYNEKQFPKNLRAVSESIRKPTLISCGDGYAQAEWIAQEVRRLNLEGIPLREMGILYRAHHHAMELQMELRKSGIPFRISSGIRFFEQAHIKDVASILRLTYSPCDEVAFKRIIRKLPGVGVKSADRLWNAFAGRQWPESLSAGLDRVTPKIPTKARELWNIFCRTLKKVDPVFIPLSVPEMIDELLKGFGEDWMMAEYENAQTRLEEVEQLKIYSRQFEGLEDFLSEMALQTNMDGEQDGTEDEYADRLILSSIHQAKGLEYDAVFVMMLCEGMFPSFRSMEKSENLEEERRLFYVAVTRARKHLYLIYPRRRSLGGNFERQLPSRFIQELSPELFEIETHADTFIPYGDLRHSGTKRFLHTEEADEDDPF
ncbi:MAG TPA: 3'-5' exonuclease, partial [Verrucomicrobiota bacterium]|nr:3'-5' exonuclease [Verrucomicrobiota bacterium]